MNYNTNVVPYVVGTVPFVSLGGGAKKKLRVSSSNISAVAAPESRLLVLVKLWTRFTSPPPSLAKFSSVSARLGGIFSYNSPCQPCLFALL